MSTVTAPLRMKLPLWRTIGEAYGIWFSHLGELIRISWLWLIVMTPILAAFMWWQVPHVTAMMEAARSGHPDPAPGVTLLTQILNGVIMLPVVSSIAVAWHRLLLRGEHVGGNYLRFDGVVLGYGILFLLIGLMAAVPQYVGAIYQAMTQPAGAAQLDSAALGIAFVGSLISIGVFFISGRLFLALPAKALERDITLGTAWAASKRNTWRMMWGYVFCLLPMGIVSGVLAFVLFSSAYDRIVVAVVWTIMSLVWILFAMVSVGFLSLAYRHFFEQEAAPTS
jgi:hypothetical protein